MRKDMLILDLAGAITFTVLGTTALIGAVLGATHQYAAAGLCAIVATAFILEYRKIRKEKRLRS